MPKYEFDAKVFAVFTVEAASEAQARKLLEQALSNATLEGIAPSGEVLKADASVDGELELLDVQPA